MRAIGHALPIGLQIYSSTAPEGSPAPALPERACELLAGLYPEDRIARQAGDKLPRPGADLRAAVLICQIAQELCVTAEACPDGDRVPGYAM